MSWRWVWHHMNPCWSGKGGGLLASLLAPPTGISIAPSVRPDIAGSSGYRPPADLASSRSYITVNARLLAPFLLSRLILTGGKKSQCSSSFRSWQLLLSICESLLGGSSKSHISVLITVHKWNFYKCFSKVTFWGEYFFENKFLIILSFLGLLYVLGYFNQKKFFFQFFSPPNHVVYLQFRLVSSILELQSKSLVLELKLEPSALRELSQSCSSDSAFRKGLSMSESDIKGTDTCPRPSP